MRQFWNASSPVAEARNENFPCISALVKPSVPFSTRNPRIPSSVRAQTTATSATLPFVIHCLAPFSTQQSPSRRARVRIADGFEPKSGSVSPKQPIVRPLASPGMNRSFCSREPKVRIGVHDEGALHRDHAADARIAATRVPA